MNKKNNFFAKKSVNSHIIKPRPKLEWSEYQKNIFRNISKGTGNTAIIARAGSSKTTSLVESLRYVPKGNKILVAAFNKSIAEELKTRVPQYADCFTLHSLGYRAVKQKFGMDVVLDNKKCFNIIENIIGKDDYDLISEMVKTVSLCKSTLSDSPSKIIDLIDKYNIDVAPYTYEEFTKLIIKVLAECKKQNKIIDFDDMIYFPFVYGLNIGKWDYVFIDEAQDMSYSQLIMALSATKTTGRTFVFLDDRQAIYGFRGCDIDSVNNIINRLNATKLSLPISYRCPKKVIDLAQEIVPDIEHTINAPDGIVENVSSNELLKKVKPGDFILSRTNAPLIKFCMALLKNGVPANIQGRDVGANLQAFVKKSKAKTMTQFTLYVQKWQKEEYERLFAEKKDASAMMDKAECLLNLCEGVSSIDELKKTIEKLFDDVDDSKKVLLSSVHRAKGMEKDRVYVLMNTLRYSPGDVSEESNIAYVAFTRSKKELYLVRTPGKYTPYDDPKKD